MKRFQLVRFLRDKDDFGGGALLDEAQLDLIDEMFMGKPVESDEDFSAIAGESPADSSGESPKTADDVDPIAKPAKDVEQSQASPEDTDEEEKTPDQIINSLREQLMQMAELSGSLAVDPKVQTVQENVQTDEKKVEQKAQNVLETFLTPDELDRILDEPALINTAIQRSQDALLGSISSIIQAEVNKQILVSKAITQFYDENKDLLPYAKYVQFVMADVEKRDSSKPYAEIFQTTANECRKRLGLKSPTTVQRAQANNGQPKPAFAGAKRGTARPAGPQGFAMEGMDDIFIRPVD